MSEILVPFVYELRKRRLKVGPQETKLVARALELGLHRSTLDGFYWVARALFVHREADLDKFDEAFLAHFRGIVTESTDTLKQLEEWLRDPKVLESLTDEQRAALEELTPEQVRELFEQRLREQQERHEGGNRWIGSGGTSPFGTGGHHPSGMSVRAGSQGRGGRGAMGMADARRYRPYRDDLVLDVRQIEVALRKLRAFVREGAEIDLDVEATIDRTAKNGGELEIVTRPPRRSSVRVLLLMDVGGSMDPFAQTCSQLFSAAKRASHFRELKTYYFHNAIYGRVYASDALMEPVELPRVLEQVNERWKLVLVGDAAMAPAELIGGSPWGPVRGNETLRTGLDWFQLLAQRFEKSVWLNPDPPQYWRGGTVKAIGEVFPMHHLSLEGLSDAMAHLAKGEAGRARS
jgi:uncharacterized protein